MPVSIIPPAGHHDCSGCVPGLSLPKHSEPLKLRGETLFLLKMNQRRCKAGRWSLKWFGAAQEGALPE